MKDTDALDTLAKELQLVKQALATLGEREKRIGEAIKLLRPVYPHWVDPTKKKAAPKKVGAAKKPSGDRAALLSNVAALANATINEGGDPTEQVAKTYLWKYSTAASAITEARRAGHDIPKKATGRKVPAKPAVQ